MDPNSGERQTSQSFGLLQRLRIIKPQNQAESQPLSSSKYNNESSETPSARAAAQETVLHQPWRPLYLHWTSLVTLFITMTLLMIAMGILYGFSELNHGVATADSQYHYVWTYLPTATFTILSIFWGRLDYSIKALMPWKTMNTGPQPSEKSVLLDYVSDNVIHTLWASAKARHFVVTVTVAGTLLLQLIVVLSSGLFSLDLFPITDSNFSLITQDKFNRSWVNDNVLQEGETASQPALQVYTYYTQNLSLPVGTTSQYAYQTFNSTNFAANMTLTGEVDAFSADLDCQVGTAYRKSNDTTRSAESIGYIEAGNCTDLGLNLYTFNSSFFIGNMDNCKTVPAGAAGSTRYVLAVGLCQGNCTIDTVQDATYLICTPTYSINRASITFNTGSSGSEVNDPVISILPNTSSTPIADLEDYLIDGVVNYISSDAATKWIDDGAGSAATGIFAYMNATMPQKDMNDFLDQQVLQDSIRRFFGAWSAQQAHANLMMPAQDLFNGKSIHQESRLFVRTMSFSLIESLLGVVVLSTIYIYAQSRDMTASRDPGSIGGLSTILARSPELVAAHLGLGTASLKTIHQQLGRRKFQILWPQTSPDQSSHIIVTEEQVVPGTDLESSANSNAVTFQESPVKVTQIPDEQLTTQHGTTQSELEISEAQTQLGKSLNSKERVLESTKEQDPASPIRTETEVERAKKVDWYMPFALSRPFRVIIILTLIALIIVLEVLNKYSQDHDGIANIADGEFPQYTYTYIPTLTFVILTQLLGSINFSTQIFQPYHALHQGRALARVSIMENFLDKTSIHALFNAATRRHHVPVSVMSIAMLITPFLTIVASGLFQSQTVPHQYEAVFQQPSLLGSNITQSLAYSLPMDLLLFYNVSYPTWTYNNLVFPELELTSKESKLDSLNGSTLQITVPGLRGRTNCTQIPESSITKAEFKSDVIYFNSTGAPQGCDYPATTGFGEIVPYDSDFFAFNNIGAQSDGYFGHWIDVYDETSRNQNKFSECPWVWVFFGYVTGDTTSDLTALYCWPYIEEVDVNATFALPDYSFSTDNPPVPDESTTRFYSKSSIYGLQSGLIQGDTGSTGTFDTVFQAILTMPGALPAADLLGQSNVPQLMDVVDSLYGQAVAQSLNSERNPTSTVSSSAKPAQFNGTIISPNRLRLKQNTTSTHILAVLLVVLLLCTILTFAVMDVRNVLPKNPCSISAIASLVAGSEMLSKNVIPEGAETLNDRELRKNGIFEGWLFSIGWRDDQGSSGATRFGIDVGENNKSVVRTVTWL